MKRQPHFLIALTCLILALAWAARPTSAHGTDIRYQPTTAIEIVAQFDNGEPMAEAQVVVYAPNDPETPWLKGQCDEDGRFVFTPDTTISGDWAVSVRTAGHGEMLHIPIDDQQTIILNQAAPTSPMQTVLMVGSVLWGFIGTALFFSRRKP